MGWADLRACAHACAARKEFSKKCFHLPQPLCRKGLRQSDVSHCFHNAITPIYRYEYGCPTYGIDCLVCRRVCLKIKQWALFRKRWALFSKRSPFLCTYSCPMFNNSCLVNEIRCEMSVKAMWNAWRPLPPAKHTQTTYIQALPEMRERWRQYFVYNGLAQVFFSYLWPLVKVGCTSKMKINANLFCILLGLHYLCRLK